MMASRWTSERLSILVFFNASSGFPTCLQLPQYSGHEMIMEEAPGYPSGVEQLNILKGYRFCICFENTYTIPSYITEKIFDAFAGGFIAIYWGPDNIAHYIPKANIAAAVLSMFNKSSRIPNQKLTVLEGSGPSYLLEFYSPIQRKEQIPRHSPYLL